MMFKLSREAMPDLVAASGGDAEIASTARAHTDNMDAWPHKKVPDLPRAEDMFVTVPEVTLPSGIVVPSFKVGKYLCSKGDNGEAIVAPDKTPWVYVNYFDAKAACEAAGLQMLRETQALAIAFDIANQDINWTGGYVGEGKLFQGLRNGAVDGPKMNDFEPEDPDERRWFQLSNGERIYDVAGHLFTWVFDDVQGDERGVVKRAFASDSPSIATAPHPSMQKGVGWIPLAGRDWSGYALLRGGNWGSEGNAGAFALDRVWPGRELVDFGFRCAK